VGSAADESFATTPATPALAGYTGHLLRRACIRTRQVMQSVLPPGAQARDFAILGALADSDAVSQQDLADRLGINRTVMVSLIDRLEELDQVTRSRNPTDRRSYMLSLTPQGRRAREDMVPAVAKGEAELTARLRPAERRRLNALLRQLLPDLDERLPHPPQQRTGYLIIHADLRLRRRGDQVLTQVGLQMRHFSALVALEQTGRCTQQELAAQLGVTEAAMVQVIDDLQRQGLVERQRDPRDRRRYALLLTEPGKARLAQAQDVVEEVRAEVVELLGAQGDQELRDLLARMV
jgi:DNA-binding MarR family transcriptional regulator